MDELLSIRLFIKVADLQSFARAAADLNVSNPTATRLIMSLENRLGTRLLNRTTRSLSLTESGQLYLKQMRGVIEDIDNAEAVLASLNHEPIGSLRIVAPVMFGMHLLAPVIGSFKHLHPKVIPEITIVDRHVDLVSEGFDVGLMLTQRISGANTIKRMLTRLDMVACSTPAYLEKHGCPRHPSELELHSCLLFQSDYVGDVLSFDDDEASITVHPQKSASSNNLGLIRQLALNDMGIAILPDFLIQDDLRAGQLIPVLESFSIPELEMNIAYPSRRHFPRKTRLFIDHVIEHFRRHDPG
ncbi:LysR family transcriptional regulator [Burkholderia sp. FERM BP-3421]|jgi:DNA-binding transcriptional LysR family regulator|uniref:LysR family transcriptional regulator n=1 Tax=Burkholderia sp. FERM BP-3421 TaxID=1494466 RepID=UPI00235EF114|nr:LysR family transcriptional regulator [Burkholderia sp. FERM BP-3421]WDD91202.1 LysR family transcriptional regulator [Burkholderia sp. FERM BP-3421]